MVPSNLLYNLLGTFSPPSHRFVFFAKFWLLFPAEFVELKTTSPFKIRVTKLTDIARQKCCQLSGLIVWFGKKKKLPIASCNNTPTFSLKSNIRMYVSGPSINIKTESCKNLNLYFPQNENSFSDELDSMGIPTVQSQFLQFSTDSYSKIAMFLQFAKCSKIIVTIKVPMLPMVWFFSACFNKL